MVFITNFYIFLSNRQNQYNGNWKIEKKNIPHYFSISTQIKSNPNQAIKNGKIRMQIL